MSAMKSAVGVLAFAASADAAKKALIVVDMQNDFIKADGGLPVTNATEIVPNVKKLIDLDIWNVRVVTEDYHPHNHIAFASTHGKPTFSTANITFDVATGRPCGADMYAIYKEAAIADCTGLTTHTYEQTLWPDHCVQLSEGQLTDTTIRDAANAKEAIWLKMGWLSTVDTYGAFRDNWIQEAGSKMTERQKKTATENSLEIWLKKAGMNPATDEVYVAGLAYDVVALKTSLQAKALGYKTSVVKDASKAVGTIYPGEEDKQYTDGGVLITDVATVEALTKDASGEFANTALIVTNMQNDYVPNEGPATVYACPEADKLVEPINTLIAINDWHAVIFTEDEHPHDDVILKSTHQTNATDIVLKWRGEDGRLCSPSNILPLFGGSATDNCGQSPVEYNQGLFDDFTIQGTPGQLTVEKIDVLAVKDKEPVFLKKAYTTVIDSYDAFENRFQHLKPDAPKHMSEGALEAWLKQSQVKTVYIMGVGLEKQIKETALKAAKRGFEVFVIEDGSKMWTPSNGVDGVKKELTDGGVKITTVKETKCKWLPFDPDCEEGGGGAPGSGNNLLYGGGAVIVLIILVVLYMQMQGGGEAADGGTEMVQEQEE